MKFLCYTFSAHQNTTKGYFIMQSITHLINSIESFSKQNFKFSQYFQPLIILSRIPDSISDHLNDIDFIYHLDEASKHIDWINKFFEDNINPVAKKEISHLKSSKNKDVQIPYADFKVDEPPLFENHSIDQLSFDDIIRNNDISPVRRRDPDSFRFEGVCPYCGAPKEYIYDNSKGKGQYQCKACKNTFTVKKTIKEDIGIYCPHCKRKLSLHHDRNGYFVYVCMNQDCSYYKHNREILDSDDKDSLLTSSKQYRLRYHYRDFKFNMESLKKVTQSLNTNFDISRIHFDHRVLGLILTYYVNYGLGARKTSLIMKQIHDVRISHQTIINYANGVSALVKDMVDYYPYKIGSLLAGDETYIKVRGKNQYVFFWSDPHSKIITSHTIYPTRDTECACKSIYDCLRHYHGNIPQDLTLITDGNPIYNAAQVFFDINDIRFDLHQVIGVKNKDETSKLYRPFKQIEERLNRTYKQNYYGTNGYDKIEGANSYMILFVCFFNFLRPHSSLEFKTPVTGLFDDDMLMPDQWLKLIEMSHQYHPTN